MEFRKIAGWAMVLTASVISTPSAMAEITIRRVNASSTCSSGCDGSSWSNPDKTYAKLGDAIAASASGDEIWVAAGTYYPDECSGCTNDAREATFSIGGLALYGGFAGTETSRNQRQFGCTLGTQFVCSSDSDCTSGTCQNETI
jgi:hypothetical protein